MGYVHVSNVCSQIDWPAELLSHELCESVVLTRESQTGGAPEAVALFHGPRGESCVPCMHATMPCSCGCLTDVLQAHRVYLHKHGRF